MDRTLNDIEGRYVVVPPEEGVSLAEIDRLTYPAADYFWEDGRRIPRIVVRPRWYEYPQAPDRAGRSDGNISFGDLVRTINPAANPDVWGEANSAPYWQTPEIIDGFGDARVFAPMLPGAPPAEPAGAGISFEDVVRPINPTAVPGLWDGSDNEPVQAVQPRPVAQPGFAERIGRAPQESVKRDEWAPPPAPTDEQIRSVFAPRFDRSPLDRPPQSLAQRGRFLPLSTDEKGNQYFDPDTGIIGVMKGLLPLGVDEEGRYRFDPDAGIVGSIKSGATLAGGIADGRVQMWDEDGRLTPEGLERLIAMATLSVPAGIRAGGGRVVARPAPSAPISTMKGLPLDQVPGMTPERARAIRALMGDKEAGIHAFPNRRLRPYEADFPGLPPGPLGAELPNLIGGAQRTATNIVGRRVVQGLDEAITPRELNELVKTMTGHYPVKVPASELRKNVIAKYNRAEKKIYVWDQLDPATMHKAVAHEFGHHLANIVKGLVDDMPLKLQAELAPLYHWGYKGTSRGPLISPTTGKMYLPHQAGEELLVEAVRAYLTNPNYLKTVAPETAAYLRSKLNTHKEVRGNIQFNSKTGGGAPALGPPPDRRRREPWPPRA